LTRRVDILCSIAMESKPRLNLLNTNTSPCPHLQDLEPRSKLAIRYEEQLYNATSLKDITKETMEVYRILRHLISEEENNVTFQKRETSEPAEKFEWLRSYPDPLVYRFIALAQYQLPQPYNQNSAVIFKLFGNAGLAHIVMWTRAGPPWIYVPTRISPRIRIMTAQIRNILGKPGCLRPLQVAYPEMMLWIIMMGGLGSVGTEEQGWFAKVFAEQCFASGIVGTAELAFFLKEFLWSKFYLDHSFKAFWDEVGQVHAVKSGWDTEAGPG
jgi:hypothetical protein